MSGPTVALNRILAPAGFELRRRSRSLAELQAAPAQATAGWTLELIGTQGIGKTTLVNGLQKSLRADWFFRSDLGQNGPINPNPGALEALHNQIYFKRLHRLQAQQANIWDTTALTRQMSRVIRESLTLMTNDFPRGFILDEGLVKNFPHEVLKLASDTPGPLWHKRAFAHLRARDPEVVVARYQSRVANRARRGVLQVPPSDAEMRQRVEEENALFDKICNTAQAFGCPVLLLHAEDDAAHNFDKIFAFQTSLRTMDDGTQQTLQNG